MAAAYVDNIFPTLNEGQRDALTCLVADLDKGYSQDRHRRTTLLHSELAGHIHRGSFQLAAVEFFQFSYLNGRIDSLLWTKRDCEQLLFQRGSLSLKR